MRTTIRLSDELLKQAKRLSAETGRSLTGLIEDALRETIARHRKGGKPARVALTTSPGAPRPGVDIDDTSALMDLMESR